jgi:hypothetical protein
MLHPSLERTAILARVPVAVQAPMLQRTIKAHKFFNQSFLYGYTKQAQ